MTGMNATKFETTIDEPAAKAMPALRPFVGKRVELIVLETTATKKKRKTLDDIVPIKLAPGVGPITLDDMEEGIKEGALKSACS